MKTKWLTFGQKYGIIRVRIGHSAHKDGADYARAIQLQASGRGALSNGEVR